MKWILIIAFVAFLIYKTTKEYHEHVDERITSQGGMEGKYNLLFTYLKSNGYVVSHINRDTAIFRSGSSVWYLDYVGNNLEVRVKATIPLLGLIDKKWIYPDNYPQEKMIEEIENYFEWQIEQLSKRCEHNPYEHLNR